MSKESNVPAFPGEKSLRFGQPNDCNEGMTKREYFAAMAMMGYCANPALLTSTAAERAMFARVDADALLAALETQP